jgi:DNA-binding SARP family transcriptional activator
VWGVSVTEDAPLGDGRRESAALPILPTKLVPALTRRHQVSTRLAELLRPLPGHVVLVHAAAGSGKTAALAATHEPGWLWYNLDRGDQSPLVLGSRLAAALGLQPLDPDLAPLGEVVAAELGQRLGGRPLTITLDRYQQLGEAAEVGRMLSELLDVLPAVSFRIASRTRPLLPLERLRLDGRLTEVGQPELRLPRSQVEEVLAEALGRPPNADELDFADTVLGGWPAAVHLWLAGMGEGEQDLMAPLGPGRPLHDYLHEELLRGTLTPAQMDVFRAEVGWMPGPGPVLDRAPTTEQRLLAADALIRHRVGVVPGPGGWHWHPLVACFLEMHRKREQAGANHAPPVPPERVGPAVAIRAFGELSVTVDGVPVDDAAWPTASRRLLELLLCLPGSQTTAQQAGRLLWPRHLARSALNSFNVALHGLRRILEPRLTAGAESRYVVRQGHVYRLCLERLACDVEEFWHLVRQGAPALGSDAGRRLQAAVELYQEDFLAGSTEEFAREKRARLRRQMLETLEQLGEWHAESGRGGEALAAFQRLLELAPNREDVWARVLELHLAGGDEYRALAELHRSEQSLQAAGIEPSGLLKELYRRIRREPPSADERGYGT